MTFPSPAWSPTWPEQAGRFAPTHRSLRLVVVVTACLVAAASVFAWDGPLLPEELTYAGGSPDAAGRAAAFGGETCIRCHGPAPVLDVTLPTDSYDVIIVGGGMAGLAALHYLKDRNVLLLEAEDEVGGQMRQDTWKGISFAKGGAYFAEPYGILQDFYFSEGIPVARIPAPHNSAWIEGRFYPNCWDRTGRGAMPWKGQARDAWLEFLAEMESVDDRSESNQPVDWFDPTQRALDRLNARDWLLRRGFTSEMVDHFDRYIPSCFGENADRISAAAFVNYISSDVGGSYTLEGGLGALTDIVYRNHRKSIRLGCRVVRVRQSMKEAWVTYVDPGGTCRTLRSKTVIMAIPGKLLPWILPGLPPSKRQAIAGIRYASYLVAAVLCHRVLWDDKGYDTWTHGTFFRDIIDATWVTRNGRPYDNKEQPHVLSLYIPLGEEGLGELTRSSPEDFKERILTDLEKVIPGCRDSIEDLRLYRYGHSMHIASPGFLTRMVPVLRRPYYRIYFAGAEVEGLPCTEGAIISGYRAASGVRTWLWDDHRPEAELVPTRSGPGAPVPELR